MGLAEPRLEVVLGELVEELRRGVGASLRVVELEQGHFVSGGAPVWGELRGLVALHCVFAGVVCSVVVARGCCKGLLLVLLPGKDAVSISCRKLSRFTPLVIALGDAVGNAGNA